MAEQLNLNINVTGNANESLGSLKKQLREAQAEVANLSDKFGTTSKEAVNAAKRAAELKDRIGDAKALTEAFNPDAKFKAFSQTLGAVAGGFSAVQGALGLLGAEGKDIEKTLLKVQSALALSQGLEQLGDLGDAFKNLKAVAVNAFNGIKAAIGSTGIGLLVIALGAIYAYWDDIKEAVSGVSVEQKKLNAETQKNLKNNQEKLDAISKQENILRQQGKSERDILQIKIAQINASLKDAEISVQNAINTKNTQIEAAKRNQEILKGLLNFLSIPITSILFAVDKIRQSMGQTSNLLDEYKTGLASFVFDPKKVEKEGEDAVKAAQDSLIKLKNDKAGYEIAIQNIDKAAADKSAELNKQNSEKILAQKKQENEEYNKLMQERSDKESVAQQIIISSYRATLSERERDTLQAEDALEKKKEVLIKAGNTNFEHLEAEHKIIIDGINKKYDDAEAEKIKENNAKKLAAEQSLIDQKLQLQSLTAETIAEKNASEIAAIEEDYKRKIALAEKNGEDTVTLEAIKAAKIKDINEKGAKDQKAIDDASKNAQMQMAMQTLDIIGGMVDKNSAAGKGIAVAQAIINTYQGASKAFAQGGTFGPILAAATIAAGMLNVKKIISTKIPSAKGSGSVGGGGGGASLSVGGGSAPIQPQAPQAQLTQLNQSSINAIGNQSMRAYVVETDVTSSQQRIAAIQQRARFE